MAKHDKLIKKVLSGRSDTIIDFDDLRKLLDYFGFKENGSDMLDFGVIHRGQ
jgi:hypothetical protein